MQVVITGMVLPTVTLRGAHFIEIEFSDVDGVRVSVTATLEQAEMLAAFLEVNLRKTP